MLKFTDYMKIEVCEYILLNGIMPGQFASYHNMSRNQIHYWISKFNALLESDSNLLIEKEAGLLQ